MIRQKTARKFAFDLNKGRMENGQNTEQQSKVSQKDIAGRISREVLSYWKKIHKVFSSICILLSTFNNTRPYRLLSGGEEIWRK